jgi:hypothetical protein
MTSDLWWSCPARGVAALASGVAALAGVVSPAYAADTRLGVFGTVGFGGEVEAEADVDNATDPPEEDQDLDTTLGAGFSYDSSVFRMLSLGALFRFYSWSADSYSWEGTDDNEGIGFDIAFLPRLRFPSRKFELYLSTPVGLTLATKEDAQALVLGLIPVDLEYELGFGWNFGVFGGVQFPISRDVALFGELGWQMRGVSNHAQAEGDGDFEGDLDTKTGQLTLNVGAAFF